MKTHKHTNNQNIGHHLVLSINQENIKALKITTWLTGIYFVIELGLGIYSGSIAVISDAFHTFSAVGWTLLALIAGRIAMRPSDKYKTFGSFRAEIIGALLNGFFLFIMAIFVIYMGYMRLWNPIELPTTPMLIAAFGGLITEIISIKLLFSKQKHNLNIKGAFWHILQTFVGSFIIIIVAIVIKFTGFLAIDPILWILFGLILFYASIGIIKDSFSILLESVPKDIDIEEIKNSLQSVNWVKNIHHIHAWTLTSGKNIFSTHIQIDDIMQSETILKKVHEILKKEYNFYFSTVQLEKECTDFGEAKHININK